MTIEQKLIMGVEDMRGMRLECGRCRAALSFSLDETVRIPERCPACQTPWIDAFKGPWQETVAAVEQFIACCPTCAIRIEGGASCRIILARGSYHEC